VFTGLIVMALYVSLGVDSFLFGGLMDPILLLAFIGLVTWALFERRSRAQAYPFLGWAAGCVFVPLVLIPTLVFFGTPARDQVRFLLWSQTHRQQMREAMKKDEVLQHWDSWGFAGMDNDSYLVSDNRDMLSAATVSRQSPTLPQPQASVADRWGKSHRLGCDIVGVRRVQRGFYIVITYECML
jgi:hypothetical protein